MFIGSSTCATLVLEGRGERLIISEREELGVKEGICLKRWFPFSHGFVLSAVQVIITN